MKKIIVIPARLSSTRLKNKVLLNLKGKTILQRVYEQCQKVKDVDTYIATDSIKVKNSCQAFTNNIIMTSAEHMSGTDRIAEAAKYLDFDTIINVQADEPFINPKLIKELFVLLDDQEVNIVTACERILNYDDLFDPNIVKVVKDNRNFALYFSRSCIPFIQNTSKLSKSKMNFLSKSKFFKHIGIYGYKKNFLIKYSTLNLSDLEKIEKLEQLRVMQNGYKIKILETKYKSLGIDTEDDYNKALSMLKSI